METPVKETAVPGIQAERRSKPRPPHDRDVRPGDRKRYGFAIQAPA